MAPQQFEGGSDPSKDKRETSSQQTDIDEMLDNQLGLTDEEKGLDPDREGLDVRAQRTDEVFNGQERREPEVVVTQERTEEEKDSLKKALATISELQTKQAELENRLATGDRGAERREPTVEMFEVLPGIKLPKDRNKWPIKLTDQDLVAMGWNDGEGGTPKGGPAEVLNILGNALYMFVAETIPDIAATAYEVRNKQNLDRQRVVESFETRFPHLKQHRDLVAFVEMNERQKPDSALRGKYGNDYYDTLGHLGEARIAEVRGITVEQYRAEVASKRSSPTQGSGQPRSRAVTTGVSVRSTEGRNRPTTDFERDSADL